MISRKDNILKRPYEERRFENHRRKVKSALPAIDNRPPDCRYHVRNKSKKQLHERDRMDKIQRHNFLLLQKLKDIKRKCRVDHYWSTPLPQMVKNKVALYETYIPNIDFDIHDENDNEMEEIERRLEELGIRKAKCFSCSPQKLQEPEIPEERIPWEVKKDMIIKRERSKSLPARKSHLSLPVIRESNNERTKQTSRRVKSCVPREDRYKAFDGEGPKKKSLNSYSPHRIVLSRGCLKLSVNFPLDTLVTLEDGNQNKLITGGLCNCKNSIAISGAV
ncbi:hypothetical protein HHI36_005107 [Cryptolaemus montrouzieri]|uniref:Uncharacterized protein n=1 Tax=Cryptolaemus montrouzieri TaxID=559131 RepID=A0ABD2NT47_9CUCU